MRRLPLAVLVGACGGAHKPETTGERGPAFDCHGRSASYVAAHALGAAELGVSMDCGARGPSIKRWRVAADGVRLEDARSMTPDEFNATWSELASTGWENLKDCTNGTGGKQAPFYQFDIKDDQNTASFSCQSQTMPFPLSDIVNPLDAAATIGRKQLGGDDDPSSRDKRPKTPK